MTSDSRLSETIQAARERWRSRFPPDRRWEPDHGEVGTRFSQSDQTIRAAVPTVPTVPTRKTDTRTRHEPDAHVATWLEWAERAAICEFSGDLTRTEAEAVGTREIAARGGMVV